MGKHGLSRPWKLSGQEVTDLNATLAPSGLYLPLQAAGWPAALEACSLSLHSGTGTLETGRSGPWAQALGGQRPRLPPPCPHCHAAPTTARGRPHRPRVSRNAFTGGDRKRENGGRCSLLHSLTPSGSPAGWNQAQPRALIRQARCPCWSLPSAQ